METGHEPQEWAAFLTTIRHEGDDTLRKVTRELEMVPNYCELFRKAVVDCAANLEFAVGPWRTLHFCGNKFEENGWELMRVRDAGTVISKVQCLFGCES